jgi:transcriptional regulator with XRE-family HTH domain
MPMNKDQAGFTKRFGDWRTAQGMTRRELARAIDVTEQTLINWEKGTVPSADALARLVRYSGISADWWLGISDVKGRPRTARRKAE